MSEVEKLDKPAGDSHFEDPDPEKAAEYGQEYEDDDDDDDDDDEIQVTIDDIKPTATFDLSKAAAQRASAQKAAAAGQAATTTQANAQSAQQSNKIDLDAPAFIGNVPVFEYNVDSVADEDKPWRKPGADITDYFNYGFNEDTWRVYCDRQRTLRALFGEGQSAMKMLTSGRMPMSGNLTRSIPSVIPVNTAGPGDQDDGAGGVGSPHQGDDSNTQGLFQQRGQPGPKQPSSISVIGTIGTVGGRKPDSSQGQPGQQNPGQPTQQGGGQQGNMPFGFPPFGFHGGGPFRPGGQFSGPFGNAPGGSGSGASGQDFSQPPPRFFNAPNPAMLAAAIASRLPILPQGGAGGSNQSPADLLRVLQSNPALASQVMGLVGPRPPFGGGPGGGPVTLGNLQSGVVGDDKPGRTPSPRGGSTPSSSPEREVERGPSNYDDGHRRRSRSPPRRSHQDDQGGRRIGVLGGGGGRRDYDRRGGDSWDRRSRDDRRDRSPDRRRGRDDRGRRSDKD